MLVIGTDIVAKNIIKFGGGFINHVNETMAVVATKLDEQVTKNISLTDHTLKDLAKLGHPYSLKSGQTLHDPNYQVHSQSGKLLASKQSGISGADVDAGVLKSSAFVMLDTGIANYAAFVVYGTSKMIPRPVLMGSRDEAVPEILQYIKDELKNLKVSL